MLVQRLRQSTWGIELLQPGQFQNFAQITNRHGQPFVACHGNDGFVDEVVGRVIVLNFPGLGVHLKLRMQNGHRLDIGCAGATRRLVGAAALQHGDHRKNLVQVLFGDLVHKTTAPGLMPHQAFGAQDLECLAQGRTRNGPGFAQMHLIHPAAGRELTRKDHAAQTLCDFVMQGIEGSGHAQNLVVFACNFM